MIHVIASISFVPEHRERLAQIYADFVPQVLAEPGCVAYLPTVDVPTDVPTQTQDAAVITVVEQWEDLAAFHAHLTAAHVVQYREAVKEMVTGVSVKILEALH